MSYFKMSNLIPQAKYTGIIKIGAIEIPCAVLDDGRRLLTQEGFLKAIGRAGKAKGGQGAENASDGQVDQLPAFIAANNLKPFISEDLRESTTAVIIRVAKGPRAFCYNAELLPKVCDVYLKARDAKELTSGQAHIAATCDLLMRGLAHIGIIALYLYCYCQYKKTVA